MNNLLVLVITIITVNTWADFHQDYTDCESKALERSLKAEEECLERPQPGDEESTKLSCEDEAKEVFIIEKDHCIELYRDPNDTREEKKLLYL